MRHLIHAFAGGGSEESVRMSREVPEADARYLRDTVIPLLQPLSEDDYSYGPAAILQTMARYSYVLDGEAVYWCVEWEPGLLVLRFLPDGRLAWAAMESPNPGLRWAGSHG